MADYLSHLIVKNLSPQENIQPRPRGRFEPSPDISVNISMAEMAQAGEPQSIASPIADSAASTSQPGRMQPSQLPSRPFFAQLIEEAEHSAAVRPDPAAEASKVQPYRGYLNPPSPKADPVGKGEVLSLPRAAPQVAQRQPMPPVQPGTLPEIPLNIKPERERPQMSGKAQLPGSHDPPQEVTIERRSERTVISTIKTVVELSQEEPASLLSPAQQPAPPPSPALAPEPAVQDLRPVTPPLPDLATRKTPGETAPTVHVTIGRIEVRATPSANPPPRKPATRPVAMSLDEYLKSRANGGRR